MTEAIIVAIITATASIITQVIITRHAKREQDAERARLDQRTDDRLKRIEEKLDIHNGYAEKLGEITIDLARLATKIESLEK